MVEGLGRDEGRAFVGVVVARPCRFGIILPGLGPNGGPGPISNECGSDSVT